MPENHLLEEKVNALIKKYKEASEQVKNFQEKIITLESANAEKTARINQLEEELLSKSISDEELCKNIEQALGLEQ